MGSAVDFSANRVYISICVAKDFFSVLEHTMTSLRYDGLLVTSVIM